MTDTPEPKWLSLTVVNSPYELELNDNAPPGAPDEVAYRHRLIRPAGQPPGDWIPGEPPH